MYELANIVYVRYYKKDEIIFQENKPGLGMYFIDEGTVKVIKETCSNGYDQSALFGPGDTLGEDSLFSDSIRKLTAIALDDCCLIGIFRPDLFDLLYRNPRFGNKLLLKLGVVVSSNLAKKTDEILRIRDTLSRSNIIR
ncbi:cyclic nucleotide-binding domain-containing protein [candidate division KSB1 bacterium]|nr:cyclic nucleotide-binding domain-containing protein [candidate division KSB1 bacterium]